MGISNGICRDGREGDLGIIEKIDEGGRVAVFCDDGVGLVSQAESRACVQPPACVRHTYL